VDHFAESVFAAPGRCWRLVSDFAGRPEHCAGPVVWTGRWRLSGRNGRVLAVWSCEGYREGLEGAMAIESDAQTGMGASAANERARVSLGALLDYCVRMVRLLANLDLLSVCCEI
jgi:hypothetical protein